MKPPTRRRITPSRFSELKRTESVSRFLPGCHRQEQRNLLLGLKQQKLNSELDYLALQKKVPKWSIYQIQNMIKLLRKCVVQRVHLHVQKQRYKEEKNKVPIELWAELVQRIAGVHEETISSAFSQMLVIAATEPRSLYHSYPPRITDLQSPLASGLRTIPLRPMPKAPPVSCPPVIVLPGQACKAHRSHGNDAASNPSAQTTIESSASADEEHCELQQKTMADKELAIPSTSTTPKALSGQSALKHTPPSASAALSTTYTSDEPNRKPESKQSVHYKPMGMKSVVDFENIYQFMSNTIVNKHAQPLTAMESAVLLDLLMSLPDELPLLNCNELQQHLFQVHSRLITPAVTVGTDQGPAVANSASTSVAEQQTSKTDQNVNGPEVSLETQCVESAGEESGTESEQVKATETPLSAGHIAGQSTAIKLSKDKGDWATVGLCPLNPFNVPVGLLKRQSK